MRISHIRATRIFGKQFRKLPVRIQEAAKVKEIIFLENPFDPRLKTHKLQNMEEAAWAFSIDYTYRIKFVFLPNDEAAFLEIGTHDIYK